MVAALKRSLYHASKSTNMNNKNKTQKRGGTLKNCLYAAQPTDELHSSLSLSAGSSSPQNFSRHTKHIMHNAIYTAQRGAVYTTIYTYA